MKQLIITIAAVVLVGCGDSPNELLLQSVIDGNVKEFKQHLAAGSNVNVKDDARGKTPLHFAAGNGQKEIVESLLAAGAQVNAKMNNGMTPLDWSDLLPPNSNKTEIIDLLHKHGGKRSNVINQSLKQLEMKYNNGKTSEELKAEGK